MRRKQIPGDLTASGLLNAEFRAHLRDKDEGKDEEMTGVLTRPAHRGEREETGLSTARSSLLPQWTGSGAATNVTGCRRMRERMRLHFGTLPLILISPAVWLTLTLRARPDSQAQPKDLETAEPHLRIGPVAVAVNKSTHG
jgi:hypothetical protein